MNRHTEQLAEVATTEDATDAYQQFVGFDWLAHATDDEVGELLCGIIVRLDGGANANEGLLTKVLRELVGRAYSGGDRRWRQLSETTTNAVVELYQRLPATSVARVLLLQLLAASRGDEELRMFAELLVSDPPTDSRTIAVAFGPLFQKSDFDPEQVFPRLLDAISSPATAPVVVDLANFVTREGLVSEHPGADRKEHLAALLGGLIHRLGLVEERPDAVAHDERHLAAIVNDSVALAISLCDALALIGDASFVGRLYQALELRHRRLRTEAAAALARLGDETGKEVLVSMAAEPITRLRVLAYAEELGLEERIENKFATNVARAEADLALWLAQPAQLGFPPSRLELIDEQLLSWPGFDDPIDCFLFRFTYETPDGEYHNIGLAGPACHAFGADLADLSPDDIFATFAGWHVVHEDIYEVDAAHLNATQHVELARLERRLHDQGYEAIQPAMIGMFLGERALVARAKRDRVPGVAVATQDEVLWQPIRSQSRPLGPHETYCLFKGRKLLRTFNP